MMRRGIRGAITMLMLCERALVFERASLDLLLISNAESLLCSVHVSTYFSPQSLPKALNRFHQRAQHWDNVAS